MMDEIKELKEQVRKKEAEIEGLALRVDKLNQRIIDLEYELKKLAAVVEKDSIIKFKQSIERLWIL